EKSVKTFALGELTLCDAECYKIVFHSAASGPPCYPFPGWVHGPTVNLRFMRYKLNARDCSPIRGTLPSGCAYSPDRAGFLHCSPVSFLQARAGGDGGARGADCGRAESSGNNTGRGGREGEAISGRTEKGASAGVRRTGSRAKEIAG